MITLRKMSIEEINAKPFLINQIYDLYKDVSASFFEYNYKGETRWLYVSEGYFTILSLDGEYILYASFMLDEEYNLIYMEFDDFLVYRHVDGSLVLLEENGNIAESLSMLKRDDRDLDGVILHRQININTQEEMVTAYLCVYRDSEYYFPFNFEKPFFISFIHGSKQQKYLLYETDIDYYSYDVITIKEFGMINFLKNGSFSLQREDKIRRYFKVKYENKDGDALLLLPFSHPYKIEEIDQIIKNKGFVGRVSNNVLDYYNGAISEKEEFILLAQAIKNYGKGNYGTVLKTLKNNGSHDLQ